MMKITAQNMQLQQNTRVQNPLKTQSTSCIDLISHTKHSFYKFNIVYKAIYTYIYSGFALYLFTGYIITITHQQYTGRVGSIPE